MDSSDELAWTPAWKLGELMASRRLSPVELARHILDRADRLGPDLGAFISIFPEQTLAAAKAAEGRIMRGDPSAPLLGVPISAKDSIWTKAQRTTMGSQLFEDHVPARDSVAVERLKEAGAIIFAKANTPEFARYRRCVNLVARETVNPWDRTLTSGGSSGGPAVAVAAGVGPVSIGSDEGGSIRLPAAFNGVFGLMPTRGRVPDGAALYDSPLSSIGPITRDVRDAALLMQILAGYDARDPWATDALVPDFVQGLEAGVRGLRIAWSPDLGHISIGRPDIVERCHARVRLLATLGASLEEPAFRLEDPFDQLDPDLAYGPDRLTREFRRQIPGYRDMSDWIKDLTDEQRGRLCIYTRDRTPYASPTEYVMSIPPAVRRRAKSDLRDLLTRYDLIATPTIGYPAFSCADPQMLGYRYQEYAYIVNAAGCCAASAPAGLVDGLPVGLQLIGRPNEEHVVLRAARTLEREAPWGAERPPLPAAV